MTVAVSPICTLQEDGTLSLRVINDEDNRLAQSFTISQDGETIHVGAVPVQVLHTPGHTAGGCCYVTPEAVFTGDTLMGYSVGRCDLPTGDEAALAVSLQKLAALPGDPAICGGHGPVTRLSEEKRRNPYL